MRLVAVLAAVTVLVLSACAEAPRSPEQFAAEYGGKVEDFRQLAASTDCDWLANEIARGQNNFEDFNESKWDGHYQAASQRFKQLDC